MAIEKLCNMYEFQTELYQKKKVTGDMKGQCKLKPYLYRLYINM